MTIEQWIEVVKDAVARHSSPLTDDEIKALLAPYIPGDPLNALIDRTMEPVIREIFDRGREGKTFGDPRRLESDILYGSVESAFPGASLTFLNLSRAFLTFWKEYRDIAQIEPRVALQVLLLGYVGEYRKWFFPTGNLGTAVPYMLFAKHQRDALTVFGNGIDVDDFFRANPLLVHTANPLRGTGCLFLMGIALGGSASFFAFSYVFGYILTS